MSRCQRYDFKRLTVEQIEERMKEALAAAGEELPIGGKSVKIPCKNLQTVRCVMPGAFWISASRSISDTS